MCSNHTSHTSYNHHHSRANSRSRFELYNFNTNEDQALINKKLPKELILRIFSFLDVVTLCRCAQVSKLWNVLALDGSNWQRVDLMIFQRDIEETVVLNLSRRCVGFLKSLSLKGCKSVGDGALRIFAQQCKNIEELCLEGCKKISDSTAISLSNYSGRLRRLDVSSCLQITDNSLSALSKGCTKLEYVNISWCTQISSHGLKLLAQGCQNLLIFIAEGCTLITDEGIYHLAKSCTRLRSVKLKTCENIKDGSVKSISENCKDISLLCVSGCIQLTDLSLQYLGNNSHELRTLEAAQCSQFTDAGFQALCRGCNKLQRLDLEECVQITDSTLNHLSLWCSGLQKLSLSHCELITDEGIRHFCGSPCAIDHIEELELDNCPLITDNALDYLINCHQLKRVELFDCQLITKAGTRKLRAHLPDLRVHEYFAPVTPPPSVGGGRQRMCRCCVMLWCCIISLKFRQNTRTFTLVSSCFAKTAVLSIWSKLSAHIIEFHSYDCPRGWPFNLCNQHRNFTFHYQNLVFRICGLAVITRIACFPEIRSTQWQISFAHWVLWCIPHYLWKADNDRFCRNNVAVSFTWRENVTITLNLLTPRIDPRIDQRVNSPHIFNTLSGRQVLRRKIIISLRGRILIEHQILTITQQTTLWF